MGRWLQPQQPLLADELVPQLVRWCTWDDVQPRVQNLGGDRPCTAEELLRSRYPEHPALQHAVLRIPQELGQQGRTCARPTRPGIERSTARRAGSQVIAQVIVCCDPLLLCIQVADC